jgi:hypothetical protein
MLLKQYTEGLTTKALLCMQKKIKLCRGGCGNTNNLISGFCPACNGEGFISPAPKVPKTEEKPVSKKSLPTQIKPRSAKRSAMEREYLKLNKVFLEEKGKEYEDGLPRCEGRLKGCTILATEVQHPYGRQGERLIEVEHFKASCNNCNLRAESHPWEAQAAGFSYSRLHD